MLQLRPTSCRNKLSSPPKKLQGLEFLANIDGHGECVQARTTKDFVGLIPSLLLELGSFGQQFHLTSKVPLASSRFATAGACSSNVRAMTPLSYRFNVYGAKRFPIYLSILFVVNGHKYNQF
ncbi:hypothetical protein Csa_007484 [Cucumis sativus]|uniref:Uncharacterized protein n=1 Tax=Cucumis sativus TaxID=3659 RepID=A0A0A0LVW4_CUCSA|nr:hypothetical protein Csa_007484 [Cucumis sativus]